VNIDFVRSDLLKNFQESRDYREGFVEESVYATVAFQVSAIREQRGWSQKKLGRVVNMAQERISILEDPNAETKPTLTTLLRLAAGFDCGLDVRFVPYSRVLNNSFNNGPEALRVPSFDDEFSLEKLTKEEEADALARQFRSEPLRILGGSAMDGLKLPPRKDAAAEMLFSKQEYATR
jgi:transcriptional regulator with XRE-family HTH domain